MKDKNQNHPSFLTKLFIVWNLIFLIFAIVYGMQRWRIPPFDIRYIYPLRFVSPQLIVCGLVPLSFIGLIILIVMIRFRTLEIFWSILISIVVSFVVIVASFPGFLGVFEEKQIAEISYGNHLYVLTDIYPSLGIGGANRVYHILHDCDQFRFLCRQLHVENYRILIRTEKPKTPSLVSSDNLLMLQIDGTTVFTYPLEN